MCAKDYTFVDISKVAVFFSKSPLEADSLSELLLLYLPGNVNIYLKISVEVLL